jgi:hypothetical protein
MRLLPKTRSGKWALGLCVAFIILITVKIIGFLPLPTFAVAAIGLAGFITGIAAIFKNKDRAILTFLAILVGIVIMLWTALEFIFPH